MKIAVLSRLAALAGCLVSAGVGALPAAEPVLSASVLESRVREVFQRRCADCHSPDTDDEPPTLSLTTDLLKLRTDPSYITIGSAENSPLFQRVTLPANDRKRMPKSTASDPLPPLEAAEIEILRQWIEPPSVATRTFVTDRSVAQAVHRDLEAAGAAAPYYRYLTLHNLANAQDDDASLEVYRAALSKLVNSLSWQKTIVRPVPIDPARLVFRLDLRHYGWKSEKWESLVAGYPYAIILGLRIESDIRTMTGSQLAVLRGDWFTFAVSQPPLYEQFLDIPASDTELERSVLHVDVRRNISSGVAQRAGFVKSGVSEFNRMIERHPISWGAYWKSYDFSGNDGKQDILLNPLGPASLGYRFAFEHDGGEMIWNLPNGLQAYLLATAKGDSIPRAPTDIVRDKTRNDVAIINGISCISCHAQGMRVAPKGNLVDEVRPASVALDLRAEERRILTGIYPLPAAFATAYEADEKRFRAALEQAGVSPDGPEPVSILYKRFRHYITSATVASEFGLEKNDLQSRMDESDIQELRVFGQRLKSAGAFSRKSFIEQFRLTVEGLHLGRLREFTLIRHEDFFPTPFGTAAPPPLPSSPVTKDDNTAGKNDGSASALSNQSSNSQFLRSLVGSWTGTFSGGGLDGSVLVDITEARVDINLKGDGTYGDPSIRRRLEDAYKSSGLGPRPPDYVLSASLPISDFVFKERAISAECSFSGTRLRKSITLYDEEIVIRENPNKEIYISIPGYSAIFGEQRNTPRTVVRLSKRGL